MCVLGLFWLVCTLDGIGEWVSLNRFWFLRRKYVCFHMGVCVRESEKVTGNRSVHPSVGGAIMEMGIRFTLLQCRLTHTHPHIHSNSTVISSSLCASNSNVFITNPVTCTSVLHTDTHYFMVIKVRTFFDITYSLAHCPLLSNNPLNERRRGRSSLQWY